MKKATQYQVQKAIAAATLKEVLNLIRWTEDEHFDFVYKVGCSYLQAYIPRDPVGIDMLVESTMFWAWWKNRWTERDQKFLKNDFTGMDLICITALYRILHNPEDLANEIFPNSVVLHESYAQMIAELLDAKNEDI